MTASAGPDRIALPDFSNARWFKSSASGNNGACVEVAVIGEYVGVRNSKDPSKTPHVYTHAEWHAFLEGVKAGEFDL
jgi:hypothetical protein